MNIVFSLLAPELEKEGSLLFKSTTANKKMFHIARDVPGQRRHCPSLFVRDQCLQCQSDLYLPERSLATITDLLTSKLLHWQVNQSGCGWVKFMYWGEYY